MVKKNNTEKVKWFGDYFFFPHHVPDWHPVQPATEFFLQTHQHGWQVLPLPSCILPRPPLCWDPDRRWTLIHTSWTTTSEGMTPWRDRRKKKQKRWQSCLKEQKQQTIQQESFSDSTVSPPGMPCGVFWTSPTGGDQVEEVVLVLEAPSCF